MGTITITVNTDGDAFHSYFDGVDGTNYRLKDELGQLLDKVAQNVDRVVELDEVKYSVMDSNGNTCGHVEWKA